MAKEKDKDKKERDDGKLRLELGQDDSALVTIRWTD